MRYLTIAGAVVFLAGVVALFPARVAYSWFAPDIVRLSGVSGTLWRGRAQEGQIDRLYLRNLDWTVRPSALLRGALALDVSVSPAGGFIEARVELSVSGAVRLTDVNAGLSLDALRSLLPLANIDGNLRVQLDRLVVEDGIPSDAEGSVEVVALTIQPLSRTPVGSYRIRFSADGGGIAGSVEDIDGMFDVAGTIRLDAERNYELRGLIVPTPEAPPGVVRQLQILGSPNERGQREFRLEGSL